MVRYAVEQVRPHPLRRNELEAEMTCAGPMDALAIWRVTSRFIAGDGQETTELATSERGRLRGRTVEIVDNLGLREYDAPSLLLSSWTIPAMLANAHRDELPLEFDMLYELTSLRPGQRLTYEGEVTFEAKPGDVTLNAYAQIGSATMPTHYLVDDAGRVQLIVQSMLSWALQSVA